MKAASFEYAAPKSIEEALAALAGEGAKLIAGGQSLGPMLNLRLVRPRLLVDVSRIAALRGIEDRGDIVWIGAGATHTEVEDTPKLPVGGMLRSVAGGIAYRSIRNRGTIGGSLAHADPGADWPLALATLDARVRVRGAKGSRVLAVDGFMLSAFTSQLADDELIEGLEIPNLSASARWGYYKFCRKTGEFPEVSAAVVVDPIRRMARVMLGALNGAPRRCDALERDLARGLNPDSDAFVQATQDIVPNQDAVERRMRAAALKRAVQQLFSS
ncbi:MAG: carbon monoxide dehydrogenase [Betaproteobacteria bacterium]|nr:carbon monoxide dehydrogenase [Betaproteobacteria bacterium]